jgi:hypothetical protein
LTKTILSGAGFAFLWRKVIMGLYLCIFDGAEKIGGVEVGPYSDFNAFRDCVTRELEDGRAGSKFPTLD